MSTEEAAQEPRLADRAAPRIIKPSEYDRRRFIGSSNVAAILGLAPEVNGRRHTALDVYEAKIAEEREERRDPDLELFLARRKRWEPVVVEMLREEFDAEITAINRQYVDPEVDFFASEIDAEATSPDGSGETINIEIKTVSPRAFGERFGWGEPGTDEVPIQYEAQVMFGLGVTGRRRAVLAAMVGLDDMVFYPIERNEEVIARIRADCVKFWTEHVLKRVPPEPQTLADLSKLYRRPVPEKRVEADTELGSKALRLRAIASQIEALTFEHDLLEFEVKAAMRDAEMLFVDGRKVVSWPEQNWSRLDQASIKLKEKEVYKTYLLSGKHRVFKVLKSFS